MATLNQPPRANARNLNYNGLHNIGIAMERIDIATAIRRMLTDSQSRQQIAAAMDWSNSDVSRVLAGSQGVPLDKLDTLITAIGYVPVESHYLTAVQTLCVVGSQCECALQGRGACGLKS